MKQRKQSRPKNILLLTGNGPCDLYGASQEALSDLLQGQNSHISPEQYERIVQYFSYKGWSLPNMNHQWVSMSKSASQGLVNSGSPIGSLARTMGNFAVSQWTRMPFESKNIAHRYGDLHRGKRASFYK